MPKPPARSIAVDSEKIRLLRQSLGWTQEYASKKAGYSSRLIRKLESGGRVRPETLVDVLQCYHLAVDSDKWNIREFLLHDETATDDTSAEADQQRHILRMQEWYTTVYNRREYHRVAEFIAPEMKYQHAQGPVHVGIDAIRKLVSALLEAFDPMTFVFPHSFFCDGYVHTFWKLEMEHVGEFSGVPATGKTISLRGNSRVKLVGDKMIDAEDNWDVYDVIRRLEGESPKWF